MFNYDPLWKTLEAKEISQYQLIKDYNFSTGTLDALRKNRSITINTIERLCQILHCTPNDIVEIILDNH
ncbi:MAG: helix-turn-helix transcriptional regulator [Lachnospiraceae bacterium]|nr:helix-turn-helix transcriptional regulator [Lachnospiraceae bacterium]